MHSFFFFLGIVLVFVQSNVECVCVYPLTYDPNPCSLYTVYKLSTYRQIFIPICIKKALDICCYVSICLCILSRQLPSRITWMKRRKLSLWESYFGNWLKTWAWDNWKYGLWNTVDTENTHDGQQSAGEIKPTDFHCFYGPKISSHKISESSIIRI